MFVQTFQLQDFMPALSAEQAGKVQEQLAIYDGQNFAWTAHGVFSAYGRELIGSHPPAPPMPAAPMRHSFIYEIANQVFHFLADGVYRYLATGPGSPAWQLVYAYPAPPAIPAWTSRWDLSQYKWTTAWIGTRHWFCHPQVGLLYYDEFSDEWGFFWDECWNGPPYAITQADNRLILLLEDVVAWSQFDQGDQWGHKWQLGSGAQSLALIRYGQPYIVLPYNNGWLTFTSMGVMLSQPNYDQVSHPSGERLSFGPVVYTHEEVTYEHTAIGPTAACHVDRGGVYWLARTGFQAFLPSQGGGFGGMQDWQPVMGKFISESLLPAAPPMAELNKFGDMVMLEWLPEMRAIAVSFKPTLAEDSYSSALVHQYDFERWGSFDAAHRAFGPPFSNAFIFSYHGGLPHWWNVDHRPRTGAWVSFSPVRLQLPNEPAAPETLLTSVQSIRLGQGKLTDTGYQPAQGFQSNWLASRRAAERPNRYDLLISSGWDADSQNADQGQYATLLDQSQQSAQFVCDSTGLTHRITIEAAQLNDYFNIAHVELAFFIAGQR